ncbi:MAG: hypothetical protein ACK5XN_01925 [Bacteroidota bacterium]
MFGINKIILSCADKEISLRTHTSLGDVGLKQKKIYNHLYPLISFVFVVFLAYNVSSFIPNISVSNTKTHDILALSLFAIGIIFNCIFNSQMKENHENEEKTKKNFTLLIITQLIITLVVYTGIFSILETTVDDLLSIVLPLIFILFWLFISSLFVTIYNNNFLISILSSTTIFSIISMIIVNNVVKNIEITNVLVVLSFIFGITFVYSFLSSINSVFLDKETEDLSSKINLLILKIIRIFNLYFFGDLNY